MVANILYFTFAVYYPWQTPKYILKIPVAIGLPQRWAFFHKYSPANRGLTVEVLYKNGVIQNLQYPTYKYMSWWDRNILGERYRKYIHDNFLLRGDCHLRLSLARFYLNLLSEGLALQPISEIQKIRISSWSQEIRNPADGIVPIGQENLSPIRTKVIFELDLVENYDNCK